MEMQFDHQLMDDGNKIKIGNLTTNNCTHLRLFNTGLKVDLCVEPCAKFGRIFPSKPEGAIVKLGSIRELKAKGLIVGELYVQQSVEYKRFTISPLGQELFKKYNDACANP